MPSTPDSGLQLYNSLTRQVEVLEPSESEADGTPILRMYGCGPTVYSYAHVGNFRAFLTADLVARTAAALGWHVRYVSNVTDVGHLTEDDQADAAGEDKLAKALRSKEGERFANVWDLARHYTDALLTDWRRLNLREPAVRPRATEHVREQLLAVEKLVAQGNAYETEDGVYFHVPSFEDYGKLSGNRDADRLTETDRDVVRDSAKRDQRDFALWKKAVGTQGGHLMQWHSPYGWGFPGWHLECSVMAQQYLGETLDLHLGGEDLRFPHHECEIAQAEALSGKPFARHWTHTRFLQVEGEKMSKSAGNFITVRDLVSDPENGGRADWGAPTDPLALRLALISGHYRKPFNFTQTGLKSAVQNRKRYREALDVATEALAKNAEGEDHLTGPLNEAYSDALAAMVDDLNTPEALAAAYRGVNVILGQSRQGTLPLDSARAAEQFLDKINDLLGIVSPEYAEESHSTEDPEREALSEQVEILIAARREARAARDWVRADTIRDDLDALGVEVMDTPEGTTWQLRQS